MTLKGHFSRPAQSDSYVSKSCQPSCSKTRSPVDPHSLDFKTVRPRTTDPKTKRQRTLDHLEGEAKNTGDEISSKNLSKFSREVQKRPQMHLLAVIPAVTQISSKTSRLFIVNFAKEFKLKIRTTREIESTKYGLTSNAISSNFFQQFFSLFFFCFSYWSRVKF